MENALFANYFAIGELVNYGLLNAIKLVIIFSDFFLGFPPDLLRRRQDAKYKKRSWSHYCTKDEKGLREAQVRID